MRLLLVDDEPDMTEILCSILDVDGHETEQVHSGSQALAALASRSFDAVLTDFVMPKMNGHQLACAIRDQAAPPPVIVISGSPPMPIPVEFSQVILKPFNSTEIREAVRALAA